MPNFSAEDVPAGTEESPQPANPAGADVPAPWANFITSASDEDIRKRYVDEANLFLATAGFLDRYCCLALLEPENSIDSVDLDGVYSALAEQNSNRRKDVLLIIVSRGGNIEPAYQISKLCKSFARERFVVVVPRQAKSAATLIALGADEIHMGPLGQLGPIDPQLGGLPALGVAQALKTIAGLAEAYPGSSEMFARYLRLAVTIEQIGYCDRISESALQYAERLLSTKVALAPTANGIARRLAYEYKDHGFVIDIAEATTLLGNLVIGASVEIEVAEQLYRHFDLLNFQLTSRLKKRLIVSGSFSPHRILLMKTA